MERTPPRPTTVRRLVGGVLLVLLLMGVQGVRSVVEEADRIWDAAEAEPARQAARAGGGAGVVPQVTGICERDLAALDRLWHEVIGQQPMDADEQIALRALVESSSDCPGDGQG